MVKKLFPERAQDEDAKQLLIYEAKLASQLDHPKIVRFLGVCWTLQSDVGSVYELVDGGDLATFLRTNRRALSWAKASSKDGSSLPTKLQLAIDIAEALVLLHSFYPPISHGNLTTKSVVVTASGVAKVWNFRPVGLLGVADPDASDRGIVHSDISAFGALLVELDWCEPADTHFDEKSVPMLSTSCPRVVAQLARRCLSTTAAEHPSALEAVFELRRAAATLVESETESDERLSSSSE
ncbi:TPA: hypothetical protein N0F65_000728 [Lagenidium giganteum]|uniref:Protein kinase domain-containing protein n=1 Tax=Lagenidium giganteum TaxID=4803 RepID=A0AAV2ZHJ6_9STRA|nr:TPA: hypothetical protein N0F65_000728 [Lagenidium giganteum]